jgi:hypothetical protein
MFTTYNPKCRFSLNSFYLLISFFRNEMAGELPVVLKKEGRPRWPAHSYE